MNIKQNIKVAVDAVVFGYANNQIQVLLIQQKYGVEKNNWALPGGFVKDDENLEQAALRELMEETGVKVNYSEQLFTFGNINRDKRARIISVSYLALINPKNYAIKADSDAKDVQWYDINNIPNLAYDHNEIINIGFNRLKSKIAYQPIGFELLDKEFPFSDLENLYQSILGRKIDRRNFRKKIMSFDFLQETSKTTKSKSGRPAKLYKFNHQKYKELATQGIHFEIKFA